MPDGIWMHTCGLSDEEKAELNNLADFVGGSDLCSRLLPLFVRSFEDHSGQRHSEATHEIIDRIERWDAKGMHMVPGLVARIIRKFAGWDTRRGSDQ